MVAKQEVQGHHVQQRGAGDIPHHGKPIGSEATASVGGNDQRRVWCVARQPHVLAKAEPGDAILRGSHHPFHLGKPSSLEQHHYGDLPGRAPAGRGCEEVASPVAGPY